MAAVALVLTDDAGLWLGPDGGEEQLSLEFDPGLIERWPRPAGEPIACE